MHANKKESCFAAPLTKGFSCPIIAFQLGIHPCVSAYHHKYNKWSVSFYLAESPARRLESGIVTIVRLHCRKVKPECSSWTISFSAIKKGPGALIKWTDDNIPPAGGPWQQDAADNLATYTLIFQNKIRITVPLQSITKQNEIHHALHYDLNHAYQS